MSCKCWYVIKDELVAIRIAPHKETATDVPTTHPLPTHCPSSCLHLTHPSLFPRDFPNQYLQYSTTIGPLHYCSVKNESIRYELKPNVAYYTVILIILLQD